MKIGLALLSSALLILVACGGTSSSTSSGDGTSGGSPSGSNHGDAGAGSGSGSGGGGSDSGASSSDSGGPVVVGDGGSTSPCDASACASVTGFVLRTATKPTHGGKGSVYVALFDQNPVTNQNAQVIGRALIPNQDMTSDTAKVAYRIDGVPPRQTPYQVIAFLDDANSVTAANPRPASGDLVSLDLSAGFGGVPVTVSGATEVHLDLSLNMAMP